MFEYIERMFKQLNISKETPFTKEYREGYNKKWIQALKEW